MLFYIVSGLFLAGGLLWVLVSRWLKRQVAGIVHTKTGEPMPELSFWSETWALLKISMGLVKDFDPIDEMLKKRKRMGSIFIGWQGNFPQVYISNPEDIKKLLVDDGLFEKQNVFAHNATLARIFGTSVVAVTGDKWQTQREVLDPAFAAPRIQAMMPIFSQCTNRLLDYWEKKIEKSKDGVFPVWSGFSRMTLDALGMAGYSHDFKALLKTEKNDDLQNYKIIVQALFKPLLLFVPSYINVPTPFNVKLKKAFAGMDDLLYGVVRKHLGALKKGGEKEKQSKLPDDILGKIITTSESIKCPLPEQELRDNMFILFIAGHDTSTSALTSSLYFLSKYPEIQKKAFNQVKQVLNGKTDVTYEDVKKLDYIMSVLRESMRLHPPVDVTTNRVCVKKEGVVLSGYMIPPGTHVLPSITLLHYDDKVWKNASKFDPDRWKDIPYDPINFMGFSAGARSCVGREYAEVEGVVVLALIIQRFEFSLPSGYKPKYRPITVALSPVDGLPLKFKKRV